MLSAESKDLLDEFYRSAVASRGRAALPGEAEEAVNKLAHDPALLEIGADGGRYPTPEAATYLQKIFVKELIANVLLDDELFDIAVGK